MADIRERYYRIEDPKYPTYIVTDKFDGDISLDQKEGNTTNRIKINYRSIPNLISKLIKIYIKRLD